MVTENGRAFALLNEDPRAFPCLHTPGARTIARDRWERLESAAEVGASVTEVWNALTDPDRVAQWFGICHGSLERVGSDVTLDFEDGEFFLLRPVSATKPHELQYLARWLGIGQASSVTWTLDDLGDSTRVTVVEEAQNPPWDWQTWNGGGWPGILDQLAAHVRTGTRWRWPWRRMGPYAQIELPLSFFAAWDSLFGAAGPKYWLLTMRGAIETGATLPLMMGDASGIVEMTVDEVVEPGQKPPSFLPYVAYRLHRPAWGCDVPGRLWLEPAGWGRCLLQAFHYNWESLPAALQLAERKIVAAFFADAVRRAGGLIAMQSMSSNGSMSAPAQPAAQTRPHTAAHNW